MEYSIVVIDKITSIILANTLYINKESEMNYHHEKVPNQGNTRIIYFVYPFGV